jgi:putative ABC transport system permease protein
MKIIQAFKIALKGLGTNRMRSALTMLGVVIGVTAVVSLLSIGEGSQKAITEGIEDMGTNLLYVTSAAASEGGIMQALGSANTLTLEDAEAIAGASSVAAVAPQIDTSAQIVAGRNNIYATVLGVTPNFLAVRNCSLDWGDFISVSDQSRRAMVAVLGADAAYNLFGDEDPVGETIKINSYNYTVIGVLVAKGNTSDESPDNSVLLPITTVQARLYTSTTNSGEHVVQTIYVQVTVSRAIDTAIGEVTSILEERHNIASGDDDDFLITNQQDTIAALEQTTQVWILFLGAVAGISLLVGGIGIMNIMLVSVTERTREIGIRKAVGAKKSDILLQFLLEASLLSFLGGFIGVGLGYLVSNLISGISLTGEAITTVVSADIPILAVSVSAAIGIIFGLYPAYRAANLKPIEALRYE